MGGRGKGGMGDAEGNDCRDDRNAGKGGGRMWKGHADEESGGLGGVYGLARGVAEGGQSSSEVVERVGTEVVQEDLGVIRMVGGNIADALDGNTQTWLCTEPRSKGLCDKKVQNGGQGATLANARNPMSRAGWNAIGIG